VGADFKLMSIIKKYHQQGIITKSQAWMVVKIVLAVALVGFILKQTTLSDLYVFWRRISVPWMVCSILAFCAIVCSMARRYWILIDRKITFRQMVALVIIQTVVGNLFATSAGAVSYVTILRSKYQIQVRQSVASILLAKFGDLMVLLVALMLSSWAVWPQIGALRWIVALLIAGLASIAITFVLIFIFRQRVVYIIKHLLVILHLDRISFAERAVTQLATLSEQAPGQLRSMLGGLIGYSGFTLILAFVFAYCNMQLFAISIGVWPILFMLVMNQVMSIVPIQVFGGLGVYEVTNLYL
jgi:uncharacterized membrane protein YbhN (UPF0104 family)